MSRTFRRKTEKRTRTRFEKDYTYERPTEWRGIHLDRHEKNRKAFPLLPLEGKEYDRAYWKYHSDAGGSDFNFWWNYCNDHPADDEGSRRCKYRLELNRWIKNPNHEVIFKRDKFIWEYC